jgi:hypothetical protein
MQCACAAILSGFFETFLRDIAEAFITQVEQLRIPFTALPAPIQNTHHEKGGLVLAAKRKNRPKYSWVTAGANDIQRRLASVGTVPYELVWEAFADTQANPGVDTLRDILASFAMQSPFAKVASYTTSSEQRSNSGSTASSPFVTNAPTLVLQRLPPHQAISAPMQIHFQLSPGPSLKHSKTTWRATTSIARSQSHYPPRQRFQPNPPRPPILTGAPPPQPRSIPERLARLWKAVLNLCRR